MSKLGMQLLIKAISLTGFMGCGKSTVGAVLAARLGWRFLDTDEVVEHNVGHSVAEIFAKRGEMAFRALETRAIADALAQLGRVLALGGGALKADANLALIKDKSVLIYLEADAALLASRLVSEQGGRPLLARGAGDSRPWSEPELRSRVEELLNERVEHYQQAHHTLTLRESETPDQLAERIIHACSQTRRL